MSDDARFDTLGHALATAQDEVRQRDQRPRRTRARAALLRAAQRPPRRWWPWVLAPGLGLAVTMLVMGLLPGSALTFDVGPQRQPGVVGAWLAAPTAREESLRFSDGSEIMLRPQSRARVAELQRDGARVVLEAGQADVHIESGVRRRWQIDAGPYRVKVTGTRFTVAWSPASGTFDLDLREGSVTVEGPQLDGERQVRAGETLRVTDGLGPLAAHTADTPAPAGLRRDVPDPVTPPASDPTDASAADAPPPALAEAPTRARTRSTATKNRDGTRDNADPDIDPDAEGEADDWRALASRASYREALAAAEAAGYDALCRSLPATDLLRLADVTRFARRPQRAVTALDAVRRRFAKTDAAAMAAFERGRIAFTSAREYAEAAKWFSTYLHERPDGAIAREALGLLMEAQDKAEQPAAARKTAKRYLARYPDGPHVDLARKLAVD